MPLEHYHRKRNFRKTTEPKGKVEESGTRNTFVIQKHAASHLHFDFRLELDGVLLSWAVPKGPSLDPSQKRLAMHVEDHPLDYGGFEGTIPKGEYGGGTVMLWDRGTWEPLEDARKGMRNGKLKLRLYGERLNGAWMLVQMKGDGKDGRSWLLVKEKDDEAIPESKFSATKKYMTSVTSDRTMDEIAKEVEPSPKNSNTSTAPPTKNRKSAVKAEIKGALEAALPREVKPQLATLADRAPEGENWLHELKWDGYRLFVYTDGSGVRIVTARGGHDWTRKFPHIANAAQEWKARTAILDGEAIVARKDGSPDFQALQSAVAGEGNDPIVFYAFDLLYLDGRDLRKVPQIERKNLLQEFLNDNGDTKGIVRYSEHIVGKGDEVFEQSCKLNMEGIISKRADSTYHEYRSRDWLKIKCTKRQEFVIGGYTDPKGSRTHFGALLIGTYNDKKELLYAGRVGTGFDEKLRKDIIGRLKKLASKNPPFANPPRERRAETHWVQPELVAEINFGEWTQEGILRHPSFGGLRADKPASEITREKPMHATRSRDDKPTREDTTVKKKSSRKDRHEIAGVSLSSPDRIVYPDVGVTKLDLALYYEAVADWILPYVENRPLALVRCPEGRTKDCFFQKHIAQGMEQYVHSVEVSTKEKEHIFIDSLTGLIALVQYGTLEIHGWGSRVEDLERPDQMVFDLDPAPDTDWSAVIDGAKLIRTALEAVDLRCFVKTSGGKGLHVIVPLKPGASFDEVKGFTRLVARTIERVDPDRFISTMSKTKRKGKVFIDYLRNGRGATCVVPYSTRARENAPVSFPVDWKDVTTKLRPDAFLAKDVMKKLARRRSDPWKDFDESRQTLKQSMITSFQKPGG